MRTSAPVRAATLIAAIACLYPALVSGQTRVRVPQGVAVQGAAIIRDGRVVRTVTPGSVVTLQPGDLITSKLRAVERPVQRGDTVDWRLPFQIDGVTEAGVPMLLRPVLRVVGDGLRRHAGRDDFSSTAYVWLQDSQQPASVTSLGQQVRLVLGGDLDSLTPGILTFGAANAIDSVRLVSGSPVGDSLAITALLQPAPDTNPAEFRVRVVRPVLAVSVSPKRVQAFGLDFARVRLVATGLPDPEGVRIGVTSKEVGVDATAVLDADGMAAVPVRSGPPGPASFTAMPPSHIGFVIAADDAATEFVMPVRFGLAILLGAAAGALISVLYGKGAGTRTLVFAWLFGFLISCFVVAGGKLILPPNLLPFDLDGLVLDRTIGLFALSGVLALSASKIWKKVGGDGGAPPA